MDYLCRIIFSLLLLLVTQTGSAELLFPGGGPGALQPEGPRKKEGLQCLVLNRASATFERELLAVPPGACVITIGDWIVRYDQRMLPVEVVSPKMEQWVVNLINNHTVVSSRDWKFKLKVRGTQSVQASISYNF